MTSTEISTLGISLTGYGIVTEGLRGFFGRLPWKDFKWGRKISEKIVPTWQTGIADAHYVSQRHMNHPTTTLRVVVLCLMVTDQHSSGLELYGVLPIFLIESVEHPQLAVASNLQSATP